MALKRKTDLLDLDLLMLVEDSVWFTEFINSTNYGDVNKNNWRKDEFKLRPYQREIMTDKTNNVVISGGRAIGKCQPRSSKIFTTDGWKPIGELRKLPYFTTYAITPDKQYVQRRATITQDVKTFAYEVTTESGEIFLGNANHPVLTPQGYRLISDLELGDYVAKVVKLPTDHCVRTTYQWHELRLMAYFFFNKSIEPRFNSIREEIDYAAKQIFCSVREYNNGIYLWNLLGNFAKHPLKALFPTKKRLSWLFFETLESIKVFIEAFFAQHGYLSRRDVYVDSSQLLARDLQQLFQYFGIETKIDKRRLIIVDVDLFWQVFKPVGVEVTNIVRRTPFERINENMRWDAIKSIRVKKKTEMFAVHVYKDETYIGDNVVMHNSIVLENLLIWEVVNSDIAFRQTHESLLITQNQSQLTPVLDKFIQRFLQSPLLKGYVNKINRSLGTLDFGAGSITHRLYARIGGSNEQSNVIGIHVNKVRMDEAQMIMLPTYHQLTPAINQWEPDHQQLCTGVHNGLRNGVLYFLDRRSNFKKYRIPSPNNPYFSHDDYLNMIKQCGGEDTDLFLQLVLAQPGSAAFSVINRDRMLILPAEFHSYSYSNTDVNKGLSYKDVLQLPKLPDVKMIAGIDTGFADPTIIQIFGLEKNSWRVLSRYTLKRIDFPVQEEIIDWICSHYAINTIGLDVGAGGGGSTIFQSLSTRDQYKRKKYSERIIPINFGDLIAVADVNGDVINAPIKTQAGIDLTIAVEQQTIAFSEFDTEGINELERLAKQRSPNGYDRYFIINTRGTSKADDDHIFASYVCFLTALRKESIIVPQTTIGRALITTTRY
jgi:hypothetical protein